MKDILIAYTIIFLAGWGFIDICFEIANLITKIVKKMKEGTENEQNSTK